MEVPACLKGGDVRPADAVSPRRGVWSAALLLCWLAGGVAAEPPVTLDREAEGGFDVPAGAEPGDAVHIYRLPDGLPDVPWRLKVRQEGIDVRVIVPAGEGEAALNFYLDRYEEEIFRLAPEVRSIEVRPVPGGERKGSYHLHLEQPVDEHAARRRLELAMSQAARVEHGGEAEAMRRAAEAYESVATELAERAELTDGLWDAEEGDVLHARALLGAANHYRVLGDGARAEALYAEAAAIWRRRGEIGWLAASLVGVGQSARRVRRFEVARTALEEALDLWRSLPGRATEAAQTESSLGLVAHVEGDYPRALDHYLRALDSHRRTSRQVEVANVSLNLGSVFSRLGDAAAALEHQRQSLEIFSRLGDRRGELEALNSLATLHRRMADYETALVLYGEARQLAASLGDRRLEGRVLNNRGWVDLALGRFERAVDDLEVAYRLATESKDVRIQITALANWGEASYYLERWAEARNHWSAALALAEEVDDHRQVELLAQLGRLEVRLGTGDGEGRFDAARRQLEIRDSAWGRALLDTLVGETRWLRGDAASAVAPLRRSAAGWRSLGDGAGEVLALVTLGRAQRSLGRPNEALEVLRRAARGVETLRLEMGSPDLRAAYLAHGFDAHELLVDTLVEVGQPIAALEVSDKVRGRRLLDLLHDRLAEDTQNPTLVAERRAAARQLALLARRRYLVAAGRQRGTGEEEVALADARARLDVLDARLHPNRPHHQRRARASVLELDGASMRRLLDDDTVLLHYALGAERSHLWVVSKDGIEHAVIAPRPEIEAAASRLHLMWSQPGVHSGEDTAAARRLSQLVLAPVAEKLSARRLVLLLDGALHYVPFAALPWPADEDEGRLVERFEIVRLASASMLARQRRLEPAPRLRPTRLAVLADPVFDAGDERLPGSLDEPVIASRRGVPQQVGSGTVFGRLPGSAVEAQVITRHLPAAQRRIALGFDVNPDTLQREIATSSIVHFATHGLIDSQDPQLSGLVLSQFRADGRRRSDGFLRLYDLYEMRMEAELVVLSGCRTALGQELRGEAFLGLASGFTQAGARRVMASLWALADRSTAQLMGAFYSALLDRGETPAGALRQAQLEMSRDRRYADPYYWGAFVIQGDWRRWIASTSIEEPSTPNEDDHEHLE